MSRTKSKRAARLFGASATRITKVAAEQAIAPVGRLIGKIELRREHRSFRSLHFNVIVTGAAGIERGHDGAEVVATIPIGKNVSAIAEAGVVVFAVLIGMP